MNVKKRTLTYLTSSFRYALILIDFTINSLKLLVFQICYVYMCDLDLLRVMPCFFEPLANEISQLDLPQWFLKSQQASYVYLLASLKSKDSI